MLITLVLLAGLLSFAACFWLTKQASKAVIPVNNNLRQLLHNGMVLTDAMLKTRGAEEYVITQTHEALQVWETELYQVIAQLNKQDNKQDNEQDNKQDQESCSPA